MSAPSARRLLDPSALGRAPVPRPLYCMRCRVTPNVVSGAVKIERTSSVSNSPCKTTPRRVSSALVSSRSSTSYPRWPMTAVSPSLSLQHAETGSADLNQLQARFTEQQKLQVDVV